MGRGAHVCWLAAWLLLSGLLPGIGHAETMTGQWAKVHAGDTPASVIAAAREGKLHAFDPSKKTAFPRGSDVWIVLQRDPDARYHARMLTVPTPVFGRLTLYNGNTSVVTVSMDDTTGTVHGFGRIALFLTSDHAGTSPIVLRYYPWTAFTSPLNFQLQSVDSYSRQDMRWMAMTSACVGVMLIMAFLALCFACMLRDWAFFWFAMFIGSYALVQCLQTGFAFRPLGMYIFAGENFMWSIFFVAVM